VCSPSEDVFMNSSFVKSHREQYNIVFFSPPYFKLELYEGRMQSTSRYENYHEWLSEYWEKTVQLSHLVLEKNGIMCYILSGYGSGEVRNEKNIGQVEGGNGFNLIKDMNDITKKYFKFVKIYNMYNKNVNSTKHARTNEKIILFQKI
jgi:hypothetical protein